MDAPVPAAFLIARKFLIRGKRHVFLVPPATWVTERVEVCVCVCVCVCVHVSVCAHESVHGCASVWPMRMRVRVRERVCVCVSVCV